MVGTGHMVTCDVGPMKGVKHLNQLNFSILFPLRLLT